MLTYRESVSGDGASQGSQGRRGKWMRGGEEEEMMVREEEQKVKTRCGREANGIKIGSEAQSKAGKKERKHPEMGSAGQMYEALSPPASSSSEYYRY